MFWGFFCLFYFIICLFVFGGAWKGADYHERAGCNKTFAKKPSRQFMRDDSMESGLLPFLGMQDLHVPHRFDLFFPPPSLLDISLYFLQHTNKINLLVSTRTHFPLNALLFPVDES